MEFLRILDNVLIAPTLTCVGIWLAMYLQRGHGPHVQADRPNWYRALLPFTWVACLFVGVRNLFVAGPVEVVDENFHMLFLVLLNAVLYSRFAFLWYGFWKESDDDYWKKKRKRIAEKIKEVGGKLVVTPEPVPVRA